MNPRVKHLEKTTGFFFTVGFFTHKLSHIPVVLIKSLFQLLSMLCYLIGYLIWFVASCCYPNSEKIPGKWYSFTQFKHQHSAAALLGVVASLVTLGSLVFPFFAIPGAWIFVLSNIIWCIAEYHKLKNPLPHDEEYSSSKQENYFAFAISNTLISLTLAISATMLFFFPLTAFITLPLTIIFALATGLATLYFGVKHSFGHHPPEDPQEGSTESIERLLESGGSQSPSPQRSFEPEVTSVRSLYATAPSSDSDDLPTPLTHQPKLR